MTGRLGAGGFALAWVAALVALLVLDGLWLGVLAKDLYQREMGSLMADPIRVAPAVAFYLLYPLAVVYLCLHAQPTGWFEAVCKGAVLGLAAYGAYNLTNLAVVKGWPVSLTAADWPWGAVVTAAAALAGYAATWGRD